MASHTRIAVPVPENGRVTEVVWHVPAEQFDDYVAVYAAGQQITTLPLANGGRDLRTVRAVIDGTRLTILGYVGAQPVASVHVTERAA